MKKFTAILLALVLALTLPLMFASDESDSFVHDHDHECDCAFCQGEGQLRFDPWCDTCGNYTTVTHTQIAYGCEPNGDDNYNHIAWFIYAYLCNNCGSVWGEPSYTDSLAPHTYIDYEYEPGHTVPYCYLCDHFYSEG